MRVVLPACQLDRLLAGYGEFFTFNPRELLLVEALRTLRMLHFTAWLARRWDDPTFPLHFAWFNTPRYWGDHILELRSTGGGGWTNHYLVKIGAMDYARAVFPLGGRRGEMRKLQVVDRDGRTSTIEARVPADPWLDLTTPEGTEEFAATAGVQDPASLVRAAYAEWIYWTRDEAGELESHRASLSLDAAATLWQALAERLPRTFPAAAFLSTLTLLQLRETELFTGGREVARAIVPFLTRLGLPIVYDGRHVIHGVRQLVNAGLAWVQDPDDNWRLYRGPSEPIPAEVSDERLSLMVR